MTKVSNFESERALYPSFVINLEHINNSRGQTWKHTVKQSPECKAKLDISTHLETLS